MSPYLLLTLFLKIQAYLHFKIKQQQHEFDLDHGGSWVQIPSGTRIFSEFSINSISHIHLYNIFRDFVFSDFQ